MVLKVCLVAAIETVVVEHRIHSCGVGVVACTYGVDIILLHEKNILQHRFSCYGTASDRVGVMAVHSLEEYSLSIDIYKRILDFNLAETVLCRECKFLVAVLVELCDTYSVEVRLLGTPQLYVVYLKFDVAA